MNVLFISKDLACGDLCLKLKGEGHSVRLYIDDIDQRCNYDGMVEKTNDWKNDLEWVGKKGLIVFDSIGYGKIQDKLRKKGFSVIGGCELGDKLEHDRQYGQKIFSACGIPIVSTINFKNVDDAIEFIRNNPQRWVVKQNGHIDKLFNYVGQLDDGSDVIDLLENYCRVNQAECNTIDLQKRIDGIEIGVGRYFNGSDWVGPIELNIEHKGLFNDNIGPKTGEMGTLMWYEYDEKNKLFQQTLEKLKPYLKHINFRGDIDINCIVNEHVAFPLEATARFGSPSTQLQCELNLSPWGEFLKAVADGKKYNLKYKKEFGIIILIATPPFPYDSIVDKYSQKGIRILLREKKFLNNIHFEEVSFDKETNCYYISSEKGYILHVAAAGKTVYEARRSVYEIANNIVIPKMFYRNDIGLKFIESDQKKLSSWGWI